MKTLKLQQVEHQIKVGKQCPYYEPNIKEDCLLEVDGEIVGFYIKDVANHSQKLNSLLAIADNEFRSENVPKTIMDRMSTIANEKDKTKVHNRAASRALGCSQYSTILGSIAPNPVMRRPYPNTSAVHRDKKAQTFIKAMWGSCLEAELIVKKLTPKIYERQTKLFEEIKKEWRFGNMYTSSISNFNIAAPFHRDTGNLQETVNIILTKRNNANGGCLNVPDYNVTFEQADNSMLVYPAWKNIHGVTPIKTIAENGYRNSFIFYALKAFKGI
tara:strand:+ start:1562 stop:2377 length:816 start_codon:yes stop_codon:yes gene_type:complete